MNKFIFTLKNAYLGYKFHNGYKSKKIEYPDILDHLEKLYGKPVFIGNFENQDQWKIMDRGEWGSARPNNLCTFVKEKVSVRKNNGRNSMLIHTTPDPATGKGWGGEEIPRKISSGLATSNYPLKPGMVVSATVNTSQSYSGSWFSFWLMKKDVNGDDRYREIDIFEKFMVKKDQKQYTMSIHGGRKEDRELMRCSYNMSAVDEKNITFTCELHQHSVKIFVNGIHICQADEPDFEGEYDIIFNDGPSTHKGKVKEEDIVKSLPRSMEIIDFRVYNPIS